MVFMALALAGCEGSEGTELLSECLDGVDGDADGATDCEDSDCAPRPECRDAILSADDQVRWPHHIPYEDGILGLRRIGRADWGGDVDGDGRADLVFGRQALVAPRVGEVVDGDSEVYVVETGSLPSDPWEMVEASPLFTWSSESYNAPSISTRCDVDRDGRVDVIATTHERDPGSIAARLLLSVDRADPEQVREIPGFEAYSSIAPKCLGPWTGGADVVAMEPDEEGILFASLGLEEESSWAWLAEAVEIQSFGDVDADGATDALVRSTPDGFSSEWWLVRGGPHARSGALRDLEAGGQAVRLDVPRCVGGAPPDTLALLPGGRGPSAVAEAIVVHCREEKSSLFSIASPVEAETLFEPDQLLVDLVAGVNPEDRATAAPVALLEVEGTQVVVAQVGWVSSTRDEIRTGIGLYRLASLSNERETLTPDVVVLGPRGFAFGALGLVGDLDADGMPDLGFVNGDSRVVLRGLDGLVAGFVSLGALATVAME